MPSAASIPGLKIFSTCPPSNLVPQPDYLRRVQEIARWSEEAGCEGILVYTDNGLVDPWLVSQVIIAATRRLCPLVAVQPAYMHPYSVAKMVASFGFLYGRRTYLNMVAGGFKNDLAALNVTHDVFFSERSLVEGRDEVAATIAKLRADGEIYGPERQRTWHVEPEAYSMVLPGRPDAG